MITVWILCDWSTDDAIGVFKTEEEANKAAAGTDRLAYVEENTLYDEVSDYFEHKANRETGV